MASYIPQNSNSLKKTDDTARIILKIICSYQGCKIPLSDLQLQLRRSGNGIPQNISTFLDNYSNTFHIDEDNNVLAFTGLEICPEHCKRNGNCEEEFCDKLHICKFFLLSHCKFSQNGIPCKFGHIIDSDHNRMLLRKNFLDQLTIPEVQRLFQSGNSRSSTTMPLICRFYNHQRGCMKNNACPHLHLCQFYVDGACKFGSGCKRNHDLNNQVLRILNKFGISTSRRPREIIRDLRMSLASYSQNQQTLRQYSSMPMLSQQRGASLLSPHHRFKTTRTKRLSEGPGSSGGQRESECEEICMYYLRKSDGCWFRDTCNRVHKSRPYQWQNREESDVNWMDFDDFINKKLESHFRDVTSSECTVSFDNESESEDSDYSDNTKDENDDDKDDKNKGEITVDFHTMKAFGDGPQLCVRRLGTPSQAALPPQIARSFSDMVTRWLWYWYDEKQEEWIEYGQKGSSGLRSNIDSSHLEKAFAADPSGHFEFHVGENSYRMKFADMTQKNKESRTKIHVRRRPEPMY